MEKDLEYYENLEKEGRLLVLPCRLGGIVHIIICNKWRYGRKEIYINTGKFGYSDINKICNTVFVNRKDAVIKAYRMYKQNPDMWMSKELIEEAWSYGEK